MSERVRRWLLISATWAELGQAFIMGVLVGSIATLLFLGTLLAVAEKLS